MDIKKIRTVYKVTEGTERLIIEMYPDGTFETINIRVLANSDIIDRAVKEITKLK